MNIRKRFTVTTVGASSVTLTPTAGAEDEGKNGAPNLFGTGTIVVTTTGTPDATFWRVGNQCVVAIGRSA